MDDPLNVDALQLVADSAGLPVKPMVASPTDIRNAIRVYYLGLPPLGEEEGDDEEVHEVRELGEAEAKLVEEAAAAEEAEAEDEESEAEEGGPTAKPSMPPPARSGAGFLTLTLLDGTTVRLPSPGTKKKEEKPAPDRGLTTRDLIHALRARAAGEDVGDVLPDGAWEPLFATLLSVLLRKGLVADWEFVDEWKKQTKKRDEKE
jgi:type IV pilus assembly protein PilB